MVVFFGSFDVLLEEGGIEDGIVKHIAKKKNSVLITIPTCPLEATYVAVQMLQFCTLYLHFHPRRFNFLL